MQTMLISSLLLLAHWSQPVFTLDYQAVSSEPHFKVEPSHYLDFPITKKDFSQWETMGTAVILKNRAVIAPETRDKKGIIFSTQPNPLMKDWMLDVELNIGNQQNTVRGGTGLAIFYLKSVEQVSHKESVFGYSNKFQGIGIYMNSLLKSEKPGGKGEVMNAIQGFYNDGQRLINVFSEKKHICFKNYRNLPAGQNAKVRMQYDSPLVTVSVFDLITQTFEFCFSFEVPDLDFNGYFLLSGASGVHNPDHVYLQSFKLYDPKTAAANDHFQDARHARVNFEGEQQATGQGARDLFQNQSQKDTNHFRNASQLFMVIPLQHNHLMHSLQMIIEDQDESNKLYFENIRGIPKDNAFTKLNEKMFAFRLKTDQLSNQIETENVNLRKFEKQLKKVKYSSNIQKGLEQREVTNPSSRQLQEDIQEIEQKLKQMTVVVKEYQTAVDALNNKIKNEAGFANKLEEERRKFAMEQSALLVYDMRDIDEIFNEMETQVISSGGGTSALIVNIGMGLVIAASVVLWLKMNSFETKNE